MAGTPSMAPMGMMSDSMGASAVASPMGMTPEPNPMPMPGQETLPPPPTPMPDFGAMPPSGVSVENTIPVPTPAVEPDVRVGVDASLATAPTVDVSGMPQMPQVAGAPMEVSPMGMQTGAENFQGAPQMASGVSEPSDPSAFKIPGIHTS